MMSTLAGTTGRRRIYLMRHGHVDYLAPEVVRTRNIRGVPLTARGRMEAQAAGRAFSGVALDRAICSGLPRTRETAELVLAQASSPPELETEPELVEIHGGRPKGLITSRKELVATMAFHFARAAEDGATMMEGGEAFAAARPVRSRPSAACWRRRTGVRFSLSPMRASTGCCSAGPPVRGWRPRAPSNRIPAASMSSISTWCRAKPATPFRKSSAR